MKLIKASFELIDEINPIEIYKKIEKIGRICYKSEDRITENSYEPFIKMILKKGHETVIEHVSITGKFICDRGVTHELVRHRIASYSQECVTGDTKIRKNLTIKELYDREYNGSYYDKTHNKTIFLKSINENNEIILNKIVDVFYKGKQEVYEVETQLGYKIKCTKKHKFLIRDGNYEILENLNIGTEIKVNGRPSLCKLNDEELLRLYNDVGLNAQEIANQTNNKVNSIIRKLKQLNVFISHKNDKNKEKYQRNHTQESFIKMGKTIKEQYENGRIVWNKGLTEKESESVKIQADSLRKNHHNNGYGKENSNWSGGLKGHEEAQLLKKDILCCELCKSTKKLEVHHKDKNENNNELNNLIKVCCHCHNLLHHGWHIGLCGINDKIISIKYIGIEDTYDLEMKFPYNNYIANGFIVHNSTRYCNYSGGVKFIIPSWMNLLEGTYTKWSLGKYYNYVEIECNNVLIPRENITEFWLSSMMNAELYYEDLIKEGWTPQQARSVLPNAVKTEIASTFNLREWRHIFKLRTGSNVHPDMGYVMQKAKDIFQEKLPLLFGDL